MDDCCPTGRQIIPLMTESDGRDKCNFLSFFFLCFWVREFFDWELNTTALDMAMELAKRNS
jgi:hypothetical protein